MVSLDHVGQHYKHGDSQKPSQNLPRIHTHSANSLSCPLQNSRGKEGADGLGREGEEKRRESGEWGVEMEI